MASPTAVLKTGFTREFSEKIKHEADASLRALRERAFAVFTDRGYPAVKSEDWKYTDVRPIGNETWALAEPASPAAVLDAESAALFGDFNFRRNGFTALNLAFAHVEVVRIPKETVVAEPIELSFSANGGTAAFPHIIVIAEPGSKATIVESYASTEKSFTNTAIQIVVGDNANLTHLRVQRESAEAFHIGTTEVSVGRSSVYNSTNINLGGSISRHDIEVRLAAEGGEAFVDGLYMIGGGQHADTHSIIDHQTPNCISHQTYKGVLNDRSRAVFNGKVFVRENAHGTDAQQSNKNLLLSAEARVDTKPQLEIFNDDVKCSHGATVGQLEEEELFYLLTRGLPDSLARNLLTYGFAEEVINKIEIEAIKTELDKTVLNRLNAEI